jgi:hypothetical protein
MEMTTRDRAVQNVEKLRLFPRLLEPLTRDQMKVFFTPSPLIC